MAAVACEVPQLGPDTQGAAVELASLGSAVVRDLWPTAPLQKLRAAIQAYCDQRRANLVSGQSIGRMDRMYTTHGVGTIAALIVEAYIEMDFIQTLFAGSAYRAICEDYFQSDQLFCKLGRCGFRDHYPQTNQRSFIPFHQDSYSQDKYISEVLNCWIPLDPCGVHAPSLEVVRHRCTPDFPRKDFGLASENAAYDFITIDRDAIVAAFGENFLAPTFEVGDALIFSQDVIHRTYVTDGMTQPRINFEFRVFSRQCIQGVDLNALIADGNITPLR